MSSTPREPSNVGPAVGGHLRVGDADRDEAVALLNQARAAGRLTESEHADRVARARQAVIFDDLTPLTYDLQGPTPSLVPATGASLPAVRPGAERMQVATIDATSPLPVVRNTVAVFSGRTRRGPMLVRHHGNAFIMFGGTELDFSESVFEAAECHISVLCMFGGLEIKVPAGVNVVDKTLCVFGGSEVKNLELISGQPGPTLIIEGFVAFGGIEVNGPRPDPTLREILGF